MGANFGNTTSCGLCKIGIECAMANVMMCLSCLEGGSGDECYECVDGCPSVQYCKDCVDDLCSGCQSECRDCQNECLECLPGMINPNSDMIEGMDCRRCNK